jgi:RHS repeat-associated protein
MLNRGLLADFRFTGMFHEGSSGLYLTHFRAYSSRIGRCRSRSDRRSQRPALNLYWYAAGKPRQQHGSRNQKDERLYGHDTLNPRIRLKAANARLVLAKDAKP